MPLTAFTPRVSADGAAPRADATGGRAQAPSPHKDPSSRSQRVASLSPRAHSTRASNHGAVRRSLRLHVGVLSKSKGVRYNADGSVVACRFCEILRMRDEQFLYEDEWLVVFRPLRPIVASHILIVPRAHIRNVNQLTVDHVDLVRRMRAVAEQVLRSLPQDKQLDSRHQQQEEENGSHHTKRTSLSSDEDDADHASSSCSEEGPSPTAAAEDAFRFAFHVPPFNSIDHVHMHAFRGAAGYIGRIKYRTKSWWCRSYDAVLARLETQQQQR